MLVFMIICLIIFLICMFLVVTGKTNNFDQNISDKIFIKRNVAVTRIMHFFTELGKGAPITIICVLLYILDGSLMAYTVAVGSFSTIIITKVMKKLFKRARPVGNRLVEENDFSFPSAHACAAGTLYGGIALNVFWLFVTPFNCLIIICCILFMFCVGFSRIYLGIHYLMDVIGGWSLGLTISAAVTLIIRQSPL